MKKPYLNKRNLIAALLILALSVAGSAVYFLNNNGEAGYAFETTSVKRGSVSKTITATGTLEATNTVVVGTQVSGVIEKLYVDFNSRVKKGQLIAELDKSTLQSSLDNAEADLYNAQAEFDYQKANYNRAKELFEKKLSSESDLDLATYNFRKSEAALKSADANLSKARRSLGYASIYAPIDGIVLNRAVEEGQTVTASLNTPELFTITNDLTEMQVEADVDEADIGVVEEGQRVEFTVDAFPDELFSGTITEVRLQPTETSNVITYTVIVAANNPDLKLKPGMTASITDFVEEANDVYVLASKAFNFKPDRDLLAAYNNSQSGREQVHGSATAMPEQQAVRPAATLSANMQRVWIKDGSVIRPVVVETGVNDGINFEIVSGLSETDEVVVSMQMVGGTTVSGNPETAKSPFIQERPGRPRT